MFCDKCGKENLDHAAFCADCGAPLNTPSAESADDEATVRVRPVEDVTEPTVEDETVRVRAVEPEETIEVIENADDADNDADDDAPTGELNAEDAPELTLNTEGVIEEKKPKKKKTGIIIACAAVLVVAIVLCCVFLWKPICATFNWIFLSPEKNLEMVYDQAVVSAFDGDASEVNSMSSVDFTNMGYAGEVEISADKTITGLLSTYAEEDLSWLESASISYDASILNEMAKLDYELKVNKTHILDVEQVIDFATMDQYISLPEFSDTALYVQTYSDMDSLMEYDPYASMTDSIGMLESIMEICPSQEVLETIVRRYVGVFTNGFGSVEKSSETVEVGDLKQNLRVLTATMDEGDMLEMVLNLMETLRDDDDIKDIIQELESLTGESGLYDEFCDSLDEGIAELDSVDPDDMGNFKITFVTYLNASNEIVGNTVKVSESGMKVEVLHWVKVISGNKFAVEVIVADDIVLEGEGTGGKAHNATYTLSVLDEDILEVEMIDFVSDSKKGSSGKMVVTPTEFFLESILEEAEVDSSVAAIISSQNPAIQIEFSGTQDNAKIVYSLLANSKKMLTLSVSAKPKSPSAIELPKNYTADEEEWSASIDNESSKQTMLSRFKAAGFPEALLREIFE